MKRLFFYPLLLTSLILLLIMGCSDSQDSVGHDSEKDGVDSSQDLGGGGNPEDSLSNDPDSTIFYPPDPDSSQWDSTIFYPPDPDSIPWDTIDWDTINWDTMPSDTIDWDTIDYDTIIQDT